MPQSLLGEHLAGRDVDQVRSLLVGIHAKTLQKYVTAHRGKDRSRDAVDREVYDQHTHSYPEMLEDRIDIGLIPNYYKALGVPRTASPSEVKRSYRKLAFIYHEDRFGGESAASVERGRARLKQILEAYGVLGQRDERKAYNQRIGNDANSYPSEPWYMQLPTEDL